MLFARPSAVLPPLHFACVFTNDIGLLGKCADAVAVTNFLILQFQRVAYCMCTEFVSTRSELSSLTTL